ncbi:MAG: hypothetical protein ACNS61_05560 [Candidatus Wenzhouxiangella sp. M2_3B_020]
MSIVEAPNNDGCPESLQSNNLTARVIRQKVWRPPNKLNDWSCFVVVGREGSGKSHTTMSILEKADPTFDADRIHFDPEQFLRCIKDIPKPERAGKAIMADESGVGLGVRSWYDKDQIKLNKVMQTARDDNMIVGLTLPRLTELDSQFRGRLHGFVEMRDLQRGEYAELSWKNVEPTRDERDKIYKKYPRMRVGGRVQRVTRLRIGPPTDDLVATYEEKKETFKEGLYQDAIDSMDDSEEKRMSATEIAEDIAANHDIEEFVSVHGGNGTRYIDWKLIKPTYDVGRPTAREAKSLLEKNPDVEVEQ